MARHAVHFLGSCLWAALALLSSALLPAQDNVDVPVLRYGRVLDVYAPARSGGPLEPVRRGVLAAPDVMLALPDGCRAVPADPDNRRRRVAIAHAVGSPEFEAVLRALEAGAIVVAARGAEVTIPRDAAWTALWQSGHAGVVPEVIFRPAQGAAPAVSSPAVSKSTLAHGALVETVVTGTAYGLPAGAHVLTVRWTGGAVEVPVRAEGYLPDTEPLRIVGRLTTHLEHVGRRDPRTFVLTLFVGDLRQAVGRGDVLRIVDPATAAPLFTVEALADVPVAAGGSPRVHVPVRAVDERELVSALERLDPSRLPGYPAAGPGRDAFVRAHGAVVVHITCFDAARGDDPANFVRVGDRAITSTRGNRLDVSPRAGFVVQFHAPVDPATLNAVRLTTPDRSALIAARILSRDEADCEFELRPPLGMSMTPARRRAIVDERARGAEPSMDLVFEVVGGKVGLTARSGAKLSAPLLLPFQLDPTAQDNFVGQGVWVLPAAR